MSIFNICNKVAIVIKTVEYYLFNSFSFFTYNKFEVDYMGKVIAVIGGDERNEELAKILKNIGFKVKTFGFSNDEKKGLNNCIEEAEYIIVGTPLSRDNETLNAPNSKEKISIEKLFNSMKEDQVLFGGNISEKVLSMANRYNVKTYDLLKDEDIAVLNAIPSAEGAIEIAIKAMKGTLHSSNCLILGYGRIGKVLANILKGFNANIFITARKDEDLAWIKAIGCEGIKYSELVNEISDIDVIFNTVPSLLLDENELVKLKKECVIIDLASKPGGVNFDKAKELGIETYWALGLPGKVAPKSAAEYMADKIIEKIR